jgi:glycosyltransferase involved in cell wall biosynthesis
LPQYAAVAEQIQAPCVVYHAYDPYLAYDWDQAMIADSERRMLKRADLVFAVAEALSDDFRKTAAVPVFTLRNAVSASFIERLKQTLPAPGDLAKIPHPIVGCTGQINKSYDWEAIVAIAGQLPEMSFVFVGPVFDEPEVRDTIHRARSLPNVHFLGSKPHDELPNYLSAFDICLNPLKPTPFSDRRSPLRLYDYLATPKPILSSNIGEAHSHGSFIEVFKTPAEGVECLRRMVSLYYRVDMAERSTYIQANTWDARAGQFISNLESRSA